MNQYDDVRGRGGIGGGVDPAANRKAVVSEGNVTNSDSVTSEEIFENWRVHMNAATRTADSKRELC